MKKSGKSHDRHSIRKTLTAAVMALCLLLTGTPVTAEASPDMAGELEEKAFSSAELVRLAEERDIMALAYLADEIPLHEQASDDSAVTGTLESGQTVLIRDAAYNESEGSLWVYVSALAGETERSGYLDRQYLACSDERFLKWESESGVARVAGAESHSISSVTSDVAKFPTSYQQGLMNLKKAHPQWVFVPMNTGLKWETVITEELKGGRSLVYKTFPDYAKDGAYDDGNWFYATREILEYYMDPRNAFTEDRIFQFELLTYNANYHTESAVESFLANTFMRSPNAAPGTNMTYAHIFWAVGSEGGRNVSPFHLAARVYQEQGAGKSGLISGTYPGYEGYYNYFNVSASGTSTSQVITSGLKYAKNHGWNNAYASIAGGADVIAGNYIKKGQDTLYLQKYNVNPNASYALYTHQYMQNISAPTTEGANMKKLYANAGSLDNSFVFKIPVYNDMPASASDYPLPIRDARLTIPEEYDIDVDNVSEVWVNGVSYKPKVKNGKLLVEVRGDAGTNAVIYRYDEAGIPTGMYVWTLVFDEDDEEYTATARPGLTDLISYHGFSIRVSGDPGIRVKSGIDETLKETLISTGVNGYKLKEYGTIVTDKSNLTTYPLVKGGDGVVAGISYSKTSKGVVTDLVYETVDGRQRFTSVLTGLPYSAYDTVYSFRGYVILTKNSKNYVIYGPIVSRSMTELAGQALASGTYPEGTAEYAYLQGVLKDAEK